MSTYQDRLIEAMGDKISDKDLMRATGVSYQAVKKVLLGKSSCFDTSNNVKAAKLLGVNSDWLATGDGPRERQANGKSNPLLAGKDLQMIFDLIPDSKLKEQVYNTCFDILMAAKRQAANQPTDDTAPAQSQEKQPS